MSASLTAQSLASSAVFNWLLLIELILCGVLSVFFFAYFDRLFGTIVSYILRAYSWRTYRIYVDIQSLQISLLGGRIFFKGFRYHGENVTVLVQSGYVTWHYWYARARKAEAFANLPDHKASPDSSRTLSQGRGEANENRTARSKLPCRIKVHVEGVEGFLYNRSPAYDNILNHFAKVAGDGEANPNGSKRDSAKSQDHAVNEKGSSGTKKDEIPWILRVFPIAIVARTGALMLGNENTKNIVTVKFSSTSGSFDAGECGPLDVYKIIFGFDIERPIITMRPNMDFKATQLAAGARAKSQPNDQGSGKQKRSWFNWRLPRYIRSADSVKTASVTDLAFENHIPGFQRWQGLTRYMDDNFRDEHDEWEGVEYGRSSVLADCPRIGFRFHWDIPGPVVELSESVDHINHSPPPEYGMDITLHGGTISYGPWTDRQRAEFQTLFFPPIYADAIPGTPLKVGELRVSSKFKLYVSMEEEITVRMPIRESSKDWRWKGRAGNVSAPQTAARKNRRRAFWKTQSHTSSQNARAYAWLDAKVAKYSTVSYVSDMIARDDGYRAIVKADIKGLEIQTSVNHGLLWRSGSTVLDCDLSVPLGYNTLREWRFGVKNDDLELFVLRDHLFLIVDVVSDWTSGPPTEFYTFTPFKYHLDAELRNFRMFLNSNDSNIINDPSALEANDFVVLHGQKLLAHVTIPLDELNPPFKEIPFDLVGTDFSLHLAFGTTNTVTAFVDRKEVATLGEVKLDGSHVANSDSSTLLTDRLTLNLHGSRLEAWAFGFVLRHLITLKENYFGEHLHFKTLEEYQSMSQKRDAEEKLKGQQSNRSNDLDILLNIEVDDIRGLLPSTIYKSAESIAVSVPYASADLRITNYYMDLQVDVSPLSVSLGAGKTELFVDSATVVGHRAFGLPPTEPTYVGHYSIDVGDVTGECSSQFVETAFRALTAFVHAVDDDENSTQLIPIAPMHDVTFLQAKAASVAVWLLVGQEALLLKTSSVAVDYNDWARTFSQRLNVSVRDVSFSVIDLISASRPSKDTETHAHFQTSASLNLFRRKLGFSEERDRQQAYVALHDGRTNRAPFLLLDALARQTSDDPPAMIYPPIWEPLLGTDSIANSDRDSINHTERSFSGSESISASIRTTNKPFTLESTNGSRISTPSPTPGEAKRPLDAFSSLLAAPSFGLMDVVPDDRDLPPVPPLEESQPELMDAAQVAVQEDILHTSIVLELDNGLRGFCKPKALHAILNLVELLDPHKPEDFLDGFQISTTKKIISEEKESVAETLEFRLAIPFMAVRFLNPFETRVDRFDVHVIDIAAMLRHRSSKPRADVLHCSSKQLSIKSIEDADVAVELTLNDLLIWSIFSEKSTVDASFRDMEAIISSPKVDYVSYMLERTIHLADGLATRMRKSKDLLNRRVHFLAYALTIAGDDIADPSFLSRPSYLPRASRSHIRNHDSWKILSRFRYVYEKLSSENRASLIEACLEGRVAIPTDAESVVIQTWSEWRTWDISEVKTSLAMQYLYGRGTSSNLDINSIRCGLRSKLLRVVLDPGPTESRFEVQTLAATMASEESNDLSGWNVTHLPAQKTTVQVHAKSIEVDVNWDIVALIERLLTVAKNFSPKLASQLNTTRPSLRARFGVTQLVQAVLTVGQTVVRINTINLQALLANDNTNVSVIGTIVPDSNSAQFISAIVHAEDAWSEFKSGARRLLVAKAMAPNLYISRDAPSAKSDSAVEWRLAATSSHLDIKVDSEVLDMIEVADQLIRDELVDLKERFEHLLISPDVRPPAGLLQRGLPKLNLAMLMDSYSIEVALLQSITYSLKGKEGRISVTPKLSRQITLDLNFDIEGHTHNLVSKAGEEHVISSFKLPSINGQLGIRRNAERTILNLTTIIEEIVVDASAVHGLFTTFKRPEISRTFSSIKADVATITDQLNRILPTSALASPVQPIRASELLYNVGVTLAGIRIQTEAPGMSGLANLSAGLDGIQINAFNFDGEVLPLPEISARLRRIFVEMNTNDSRGTRPCGKLGLSAAIQCTRRTSQQGYKRSYKVQLSAIEVHAFAETASAVVDVLNNLQDRIKDLDLSREKRYLQRLRQPTRKSSLFLGESMHSDMTASGIFASAFSVSLIDIQICWIIGNSVPVFEGQEAQDLVLSLKMIDLRSRSRSSSRLTIHDLQLQMVPVSQDKRVRSRNSALLPEMLFNVAYASTEEDRKITFQAKGKALDVRLESQFILPANMLQRSISLAVDMFRKASESWEMTPTASGLQRKNPFGDKRLSALLVDADFAGAVIRLEGHRRSGRDGRFGQFSDADATFRTPGIALKVEYNDSGRDSTFTAEFKISASSNAFTPTVVPLVLDISNSIKAIVEQTDHTTEKLSQSFFSDERFLNADPEALLGSTSFNLGIRVCRQEFSLGCQPFARVDAAVAVEDVYITANSIKSPDHPLFFAVGASFEKLQASVQHMYSRESTFSFDMERLVLSVMNSKHVSGTAGISAVVKVFPMKSHINARQLQDFLLFRDIWIPEEIRQPSRPAKADEQDYLVQRYQQVATATAFPWTATMSVESIEVDLDMGQAVGKASLLISDMWANSKKASNWEQNLCFGIEKMSVESTGRTSGFVELADFQIRTSITWAIEMEPTNQTPLIQASVGFDRLRVKAAFDYQAFGIVDVSDFTFLMYNVRETDIAGDRLVAILDGGEVHACCTAASAAQGMALYQALEKLVQENQAAYSQSLKDIERYIHRQSRPRHDSAATYASDKKPKEDADTPISLHTDVVVTLRSINLGAFPSSFSDSTVFLLDASNIQARFAVKMDNSLIHSGLGMTLGQLQLALTSVSQPGPKTLQEISVEDVVRTMESARGGIILRVPKVVARMQTWQAPRTSHIDYLFRSSFEGKVDVGWNYARISFIRDMWNTHSLSLASRLGKPLPESAVRITTTAAQQLIGTSIADPDAPADEGEAEEQQHLAGRITAVVNVPQSRYEYRALEPPVIETPQLRDMGEATPPLEWIGLHRDRLPNITHQIVIVGLLGVAREVEDAYVRILGP